MPIPLAKLAQKKAKLRAKLDGTMVTLSWTEWPNGAPTPDPTTGAMVASGALQPVRKTATVRAFVHIHEPIKSTYHAFSEIMAGDAIVDFPCDLLRITDAGDTAFEVGDVVDEIAFSQANLDVENSAIGDDFDVSMIEAPTMTFAGHTWVQKKIGDALSRNWDAVYSGFNLTRSYLMTHE